MTKKEEKIEFDFKPLLNELQIPFMLKKGFEYYIQENNIKIKSESELNKYLDKFKKESAEV